MGKRDVKTVKPAAPTRLPAKGNQGHPRRTPQLIADPAGLCDTYDVADNIAERMANDEWKGFPASAQTWEPVSK